MAVWLSMSMSYVGPGDSANTSKIAVSVNVSWDAKHFNRDGGTLKVTVDGVTDTKTAPFNAGETSSGSQNIYNYYWNISQPNGAARTISASATFQATNATTATPTSATLSLPAISGGSGGGNTGGGTEGGGSQGGGSSGGGDDGGGTEGGGSQGGTPVIPPGGGSTIDPLPGNCTFILQVVVTPDTGSLPYHYVNHGSVRYASESDQAFTIIQFTTPDFVGVSDSLFVFLYDVGGTLPPENNLCYALCNSDSNYRKYLYATDVVNDSNQIVSGPVYSDEWAGGALTIPTDQVEPLKTYYLMLWLPSENPSSVTLSMGEAQYHGITVNYHFTGGGDDSGGDDTATTSTRGVFYIDNGSELVEYECYIDNGTDWSLIGCMSSGAAVQRHIDSFTTDSSGNAVIECGFRPDALYITRSEFFEGNLQSACIAFTEAGRDTLESCIMNDEMVVRCSATRTETGVQLAMSYYSSGWNAFESTDGTLNYIAIKYT